MKKKNLSKILEILKDGSITYLISDAGTPCISDPGKILVNEFIKNDINIYPIPGSSSVTSAVSVSGFSEKFFFYGFFPEKNKDLLNDLDTLSNPLDVLLAPVSFRNISKVALAIISSVLL